MSDRIFIFDTTLRDGEQSPGATMNLKEKLRLANQLEVLGVDCIEAGFPAASQGDFASVQAIAEQIRGCEVAGLARCNDNDIDKAWEAIKNAANPRIHIFLATSPIHMTYKLRKTSAEVIKMAISGIKRAAKYTSNIEFSCEDASRSDPNFLVQAVTEAIRAGARIINLPDTVGYAVPQSYAALIAHVIAHTPNSDKAIFSVHCHDDLGLGVANTLAALQVGARQAEVTLSGIGERAGNTSLEEIAMAMRVRSDEFNLHTNIRSEQIYPSCRMLSMIIGQPIPANKAIIGGNAFAHESGIHQDGMLKNRETYEIMTPQSIGRTSSDLVIGKHSGRNAVRDKLENLGYANLTEEQFNLVFDAVKNLADKKKVVHDEDIEALIMGEIYRIPERYKLISLSVQSATSDMPATAAIVMQDGTETKRRAGFGVGPVDATFNVINELVERTPQLERYAVNAITGGTDALGEVSVRLNDGTFSATGRGSDPDVINASARAYIDALNRVSAKERETEEE